MRGWWLLLSFLVGFPAFPCALLANLANYQRALVAIAGQRFTDLPEICRSAGFSEEQKAVLFRLLRQTGSIPDAVAAEFLQLNLTDRAMPVAVAVPDVPEEVYRYYSARVSQLSADDSSAEILPVLREAARARVSVFPHLNRLGIGDEAIQLEFALLQIAHHPEVYLRESQNFNFTNMESRAKIMAALLEAGAWPVGVRANSTLFVPADSDLPILLSRRILRALLATDKFWQFPSSMFWFFKEWVIQRPESVRNDFIAEFLKKWIVRQGWNAAPLFAAPYSIQSLNLADGTWLALLAQTVRKLPADRLREVSARDGFFFFWSQKNRLDIRPFVPEINDALFEVLGSYESRYRLAPRPPA